MERARCRRRFAAEEWQNRGCIARSPVDPLGGPPRRRVASAAGHKSQTERELRRSDGTLCALTQAEYRLLEAFVEQPRRVWTRDQLLERTRSLETEVFDRTIDVLILRLRRKIEPNPKHPQFICTERGLGYVFAASVERVGM